MLARRAFSARRPPKDPKNARIAAFIEKVWSYWKEKGRHDLPWRKTSDPYKVLVSEIMLQQTQVQRVIGKYHEFLREFPNVHALARSHLASVLRVWSGMGYNRRAKYLHDAAKVIVQKHRGSVPVLYSELVKLPGVGDYSAKAVRVFAYNLPEVLIETNVRAVFLHHFFPFSKNVADAALGRYIALVISGQNPRTIYSALMDYGSRLKQLHPNPSRRSKHHVKQSKFEGSLRQARGAILRALHPGARAVNSLRSDLEKSSRSDRDSLRIALASLARDGLIQKKRGNWQIA